MLEPEQKNFLQKKLNPLLDYRRTNHLKLEDCFSESCVYGDESSDRLYKIALAFIEKKIQEHDEYIKMLESWINIPPRFRDKNFENFIEHCSEAAENKQYVIEYADNFKEVLETGKNLILLGNVGTGKTHLIYSLSRFIVKKYGLHVKYSYMIYILDAIKEAYGKKKKDRYDYSTVTVDDIVNSLIDAPLLVIDEVGVQYGTDHEQNVIYQIIDKRYLAQKPTVVISNCNVAELTTVIGERSISRLNENAEMLLFRFADQRGRFK